MTIIHSDKIIQIPIGLLEHHPENPRTDLGDLSELTESIRRQGVLQNLTVVPDIDSAKYLVVIGNRRFEAAKAAGLAKLPCRISDMDHKTQVATMLAENMHRQDLTVYEQAMGFQTMMDLGFTAAEIGEKTGFSERTVNARIKLTKFRKMDFEAACRRGATLMDFAELDRIEKADVRYAVMMKAGTPDFKAALTRAIKDQEFEKHEKRLIVLMGSMGLQPIPTSERYSNKYESFLFIDVDKSNAQIMKEFEKKAQKGETYAYEINRFWGDCGQLLIKHVVKHATALSESEKKQRAESRKRNDHLRKTKAFYKEAFDLRCAFVKEFSSASGGGGISGVTEKCLRAALNQKQSWDGKLMADHHWDDAYIRMIFDLPEKPEKDEDLFSILDEKANLCRIMLAFALGGGIVHDSPDIGWYDRSDGTFETSSYYKQDADRVYALLEDCGYRLSEMEEQLRDGTHECYQWDE